MSEILTHKKPYNLSFASVILALTFISLSAIILGELIFWPKRLNPRKIPSYQTCHRRFQQWVRQGVFRLIAIELAQDLAERGKIDIKEAFA